MGTTDAEAAVTRVYGQGQEETGFQEVKRWIDMGKKVKHESTFRADGVGFFFALAWRQIAIAIDKE
jgi:hypothetical protein